MSLAELFAGAGSNGTHADTEPEQPETVSRTELIREMEAVAEEFRSTLPDRVHAADLPESCLPWLTMQTELAIAGVRSHLRQFMPRPAMLRDELPSFVDTIRTTLGLRVQAQVDSLLAERNAAFRAASSDLNEWNKHRKANQQRELSEQEIDQRIAKQKTVELTVTYEDEERWERQKQEREKRQHAELLQRALEHPERPELPQ